MKLTEAKMHFIYQWGVIGSEWGMTKAMAQIHGLMLTTPGHLSYDEVIEQLQMSRASANLNIRELVDIGLAAKINLPGERKEYFAALRDIPRVAAILQENRRRKAVDPLLRLMGELREVTGDKAGVKAFSEMVSGIVKVLKM